VSSRRRNQFWLDYGNSASADIAASFGGRKRSDLVLYTLPYRVDASISDLVGDLRQAGVRTPSLPD
jgi:hypothetical protein